MGPADSSSTVPGALAQRRRGEPLPDDTAAGPPIPDLAALEERARELLPAGVADYYAGGAETETTLREAPGAWRSWRLRPRVLRGVASVDVGTTLLGTDVRTPIGVAPWAYQSLAHSDGECGTARGAAAVGALMTVSTSASTALADVAATEPAGPRWFQLYRLHSPAHTDDLARRAAEAGYRALVLTVDLPVLGRRLRDLANDFALPADFPLPNHPVGGSLPVSGHPPWTFDDIGRFGDLSGLPVVVKGVLRGDDAARCVQAGAAAVWVSTHGGRQADPVVASAHALPEVRRRRAPVGLGRPHRTRPGSAGRVRRPAGHLGAGLRRCRRRGRAARRPDGAAGTHDGALRAGRRPVGAPRHGDGRALTCPRAVTGAARWATTGERPALLPPGAWAPSLTTSCRSPP